MEDLLTILSSRVLLGDGAMGTRLYAKGIYINQCFDLLNLTRPKLVQEVHKEYIDAGSELIETNTYGANFIKLQKHGIEDHLEDINKTGVRLARELAGDSIYVAASIGPLGIAIEPYGKTSFDEVYEYFKQQALALIDTDLDCFMFETFNRLEELLQAVRAFRELTDKPIIAQITVGDDGKMPYGTTPAEAAVQLSLMSDVIGINCSVGPQIMLDAIMEMAKSTDKHLIAQPNAGVPKMIDGRFIYLSSPEYFAEYAKRFIQHGVRIIGGCCGTDSAHIRAMKAAIKALTPSRIEEVVVQVKSNGKIDEGQLPLSKGLKSSLARKMVAGKYVTSVEIDPPRGTNFDKVLEGAKALKDAGIDAINIADGPRASARMSAIALAKITEENVGIETILHYTCRDRNLLGLQSGLLGASILGLRNILAVTGDPPKLGDYPTATAVYDVDAVGLVQILNRLNHGLDVAGNPIGNPCAFYIGVGANPGAIDIELEHRRLYWKIDAGAEFILTQPVFEPELYINFMERIKKYNIPVMVGILPLISYKNAEFLHNEVPGMSIPLEIRERMRLAGTGTQARQEGIKIARETFNSIKSISQGAYFMAPFGNLKSVLEIVE